MVKQGLRAVTRLRVRGKEGTMLCKLSGLSDWL